MIIAFDVNFNIYERTILDNYGHCTFRCPCCNASRSFIRHATYFRNICIFENFKFCEKRIKILRLLCKSCKSTHAVLPAETLPYGYYSFSCIFEIFIQYYMKNQSGQKISDKYSISFQIAYKYISRYISFLQFTIYFILTFLKIFMLNYNSSPKTVLTIIAEKLSYETFLKYFFKCTKKVFLFTRRGNILSQQLR
jgi:hypothetical protein